MKFSNPVLPGFYPDPSVCRVGDDFYLATSSFEYFPGVPIFHSRDLVNWRQIGHALTRGTQVDLRGAKASGGIFAPTIRFHEGRFYIVTTDTTGIGNFLVHAEDPAGAWSDPVRVPLGGIDPFLFFHEGRTYFASTGLLWAESGLYLTEIDLSTGLPVDVPRFLWSGTGGKFPEGPRIYLMDGWFYLLIAEGGTEFGHAVTMARSRELYGPYAPCPRNPILTHRATDLPLQSVGHADLVEDGGGRWWMVFHGVRHVGYPQLHHLGRETCVAPMKWAEDGWPLVNGGDALGLSVDVPDAPEGTLAEKEGARDDFDGAALGLDWNFRRNPLEGAWCLGRRAGHLSLRCAAATLDDVAPMAFVGRRQRHFDCRAEVLVDFSPASVNEEAGLSVQMNERYHAEVCVTLRGGRRVAVLRRRLSNVRTESAGLELPDGPVGLRVVADELEWRLEARLAEGWTALAEVECRQFSTELAGGFTGIYLGLYATGNGTEGESWADFDWFEYEALPEGNPGRKLKSQTTPFWTGGVVPAPRGAAE